MNPRIGRSSNVLVLDQARRRQTPKTASTFKTVLAGGADVLLSGAAAASKIVGLPVVSAALSRARTGSASSGNAATSTAAGGVLLNSALNQQQADDFKLLALQSEIQRHNRQVTLVSNVMKSRHDTAKSAITNMRA